MAIHLTGAISFQDLINEFDVPKPVSLSQMYAGGAYVPEANTGVPNSGGGQSGRVNSGGGSGDGRGTAGSQGSFASAGAAGSPKAGAGGTWGAGGAAVDGNSLINWVSEGTIMGERLN